MVKAYVLLKVGVEQIDDVYDKLQGVEGVKSADSLTGPFDMIAVVEAEDMAILGDLVTKRIAVTSGVISTLTCVAVKQDQSQGCRVFSPYDLDSRSRPTLTPAIHCPSSRMHDCLEILVYMRELGAGSINGE